MRYEHSLILVYFSSVWNILLPKNLTKSKQTNNLCENFCTTSDNLTRTAEHKLQSDPKFQNLTTQQTRTSAGTCVVNRRCQTANSICTTHKSNMPRSPDSPPHLHFSIPSSRTNISSHLTSAQPYPVPSSRISQQDNRARNHNTPISSLAARVSARDRERLRAINRYLDGEGVRPPSKSSRPGLRLASDDRHRQPEPLWQHSIAWLTAIARLGLRLRFTQSPFATSHGLRHTPFSQAFEEGNSNHVYSVPARPLRLRLTRERM